MNMVHPDDVENIKKIFFDILANGDSFSVEYRMKRENGIYSWLLGRGKVIEKDSEGKTLRLSG